jgi:GT2 family glycosyltransferase
MEVPLVSAVAVLRNNPERAEQTLQALLPHASLFREIVVIDDGSKDLTADTISSLLSAFPAENVQFYRNPEPAGRGVCINQVLPSLTAPLVWIAESLIDFDPEAFASIHRGHLDASVLLTSEAGGVQHAAAFLTLLEQRQLPTDVQFLFNVGVIPPRDLFVNPFLDETPGAEWAARILLSDPSGAAQIPQPFFVSSQGASKRISETTARQVAWSLLSATGMEAFIPLTGIQPAAAPVTNVEPLKPEPTEESKGDRTTQNLLDRIGAYINAGRYEEAAFLSELIDAEDPVRAEIDAMLASIVEEMGNMPQEPIPLETPENGLKTIPAGGEHAPELDNAALALTLIKTSSEQVEPLGEALLDEPEWVPAVSVVIPTTIDGRALLEACLISIERNESPARTELIVVDNASLDDTAEYLEQLSESGFFNIKVISNPVNRGVAAAYNQGLQAASAEIVVFLHNDAELFTPVFGDLEHALRANPEFGIVATRSLPLGAETPAFDSQYLLHETQSPQTVCFAVRKADGFTFDERYGLAWFEEADLLIQVLRAGMLLGKLENRCVFHLNGTTTTEAGQPAGGELFHQNKALFERKWERVARLPEHLLDASPVNQLLAISELLNPYAPEAALVQRANQLLTAEVRTEILTGYWEREPLFSFIKVFALTDHRDLVRSLEEKASSFTFHPELALLLVQYYFQRNIYSRCEHYLAQITEASYLVRATVFRMEIALAERNYVDAVELSQWLVENAPVNADMFALLAKLNAAYDQLDDADKYYQQAHQVQPQKYPLPAPHRRL